MPNYQTELNVERCKFRVVYLGTHSFYCPVFTRDSIYAIARNAVYMLSPVRLSVRLSVCQMGGSYKNG